VEKISFGKFNFKNGIVFLLLLLISSLILLPLAGENIFDYYIWFLVLFFIGGLMTYFNYAAWKKIK
jgi:hypothetical protein